MASAPRLPFDEHLGIPRPDWDSFLDAFDDLEFSSVEAVGPQIEEAVLEWARRTAEAFGQGARVGRCGRVIAVAGSRLERILRECDQADRFLESKIGSGLRPLDGLRPIVVFDAPSVGAFTDSLDAAYGDDEEGLFRGDASVFLPYDGYGGHVLLTPGYDWALTGTLAHELTHERVAGYPVPLWLNEGLAQLHQEEFGGTPVVQLTPERQMEHIQHWRDHGLDGLWSGGTFGDVEDSGFAYELAYVMTAGLMERTNDDPAPFLLQAHAADAGSRAARKLYGASILALVEPFLGPGGWEAPPPMPEGDGEGF